MAYENFLPVDKTITPSDDAYTANDVVGGLLTLTMKGGNGKIHGVIVAVGEASIAVPATIWLYSAVPTVIADNAAFAPVHADNKKLMGKLLLPTADALNGFNVYTLISTIPIPFWTGVVYAYMVTTGTPNFTGVAQEIGLRFLTTTGA